MTKQLIQIENVNSNDFKNEIITGVNDVLQKFVVSMQNNHGDKLLNRVETADLYGVSLVTLWDWTRKDLIPAYRIGNKVRYKKSEVLESLNKMNNFKINQK